MAGAKEPEERGRRRKVNGEGTIFQRSSDGLWIGAAYVHTASGRIERKRVSSKSFEETRAKLVRLQSNNEQGVPVPDKSVTVADYMAHWLAGVGQERRPTTHQGYETVVRLHIVPILGRKRLDRLTGADVRHFMATVRAKCLCCANGKNAWRNPGGEPCCRDGHPCCGANPRPATSSSSTPCCATPCRARGARSWSRATWRKLVKVPTPKYKVGRGLPVAEAKKLLKAAEGTRWHALYVTAATLGLRHGELLGLRWQDIDFERRDAHRGADRRAGRRPALHRPGQDRRVGGDDPAAEGDPAGPARAPRPSGPERAVAREVWQDHDLVFPSSIGTPMEPRNLSREFTKLRERAGMPGVRLHDLRHTVVSLLLDLGTPPHVVQAIARHADIDVTMTIYAHTNLDAMRQALDAIEWEDL